MPRGAFRHALVVLQGLAILAACTNMSAVRRERADAHYRLANSYLQQGRGFQDEVNRRTAYPELMEAIKLDPKSARYRLVLGTLYLYNRELGKAEREILTALELDPNLAEAHNNLGQIYVEQGRLNEAIREFTRALNNLSYQTPEYAYHNLGMANFRLGDYPKAVEAFEKSLAILPTNEEAQFFRGRSFSKMGRLAEASEAFTAAVEMRPDSPRTHYELGVVKFKLNRKEEASRHFEEVVRLDPSSELGEQAQTYIKILR